MNHPRVAVLSLLSLLSLGCGKKPPPVEPSATAQASTLDQARPAGTDPAPPAPAGAGWDVACSVSGSEVEGTVTNHGSAALQVSGMVSFEFSSDTTTQSTALQTTAAAIIPPGRSGVAARARLPFQLFPGAKCRFDPGAALKKLG